MPRHIATAEQPLMNLIASTKHDAPPKDRCFPEHELQMTIEGLVRRHGRSVFLQTMMKALAEIRKQDE